MQVSSAMKSQRQDLLTITTRITRSKTPNNIGENSLPISVDLILEILSRLPAKSVARCRCVSKFWASILRLPGFKELFFTKSSSHSQILFACQGYRELFLFTLPQLQNSNENSSSLVVTANHLTKFPFDDESSEICGPVRGLICCTNMQIVKGKVRILPVISNPTTGKTLNLPKLKKKVNGVRSFLGYDPIGKQYKLLSRTWLDDRDDESSMEYQVMTLGREKLSWRRVECCMPHYPAENGICINGNLYYAIAVANFGVMILCFDLSSEKFTFINKAKDMVLLTTHSSTLVNYNGKLGALLLDGNEANHYELTGKSKCIELWVLEDLEKHEWSKHIHVLPPVWENVVGKSRSNFVGMIGMNEIVLSPQYLVDSGPFYVYYYNIEKNNLVRVGVQGMGGFRDSRIHTFLNHVENVELM